MKKIILAISVAALFAFAACDKHESSFDNQTEKIQEAELLSFSSSILPSQSPTRTVLSGNTKVLWEYDDEITVYNGTNFATFTNDLASGTNASVTYSGSLASAAKYYAMYPVVTSKPSGMDDDNWNTSGPWYVDATVFKGPVYSIPATQTAVTNGIQDGLDVLVASTTGSTMSFNHACAAINFTIDGSSPAIKSIKVDGAKIVGNYYYRFEEGHEGEQGSFSGSSGSVTLSMGGSTFSAGEYYIMIAARSYPSGLSFTFTRSDGQIATATLSGSLTATPGHVYPMGTIGGLTFNAILASAPSVGDSCEGGICAFVDNGNKYALVMNPAESSNGTWDEGGAWVATLGEGWYMPSLSEYISIRGAIVDYGFDTFSAKLTNALQKKTYYWTSTPSDTKVQAFKFYNNAETNYTNESVNKTGSRPSRAIKKVYFE